MMGQSFRNFRLLLWKNYLLQRRNWKTTLLEFILPLFITGILLSLRHVFKSTVYDENTVYPTFNIDQLPRELEAPTGTWKLGYTHNHMNATGYVMDAVAQSLKLEVKGFVSEDKYIDEEVKFASRKSSYLGLLAFTDSSFMSNGSFSKDVKYKIRLSSTPKVYKGGLQAAQKAALKSWFTKKDYPLFQVPEPRSDSNTYGGPPGYYTEGFLTLQHAISSAIISHISANDDMPDVLMQRFPYPPYLNDTFLYALQAFFSIIILFSFIYTSINITKSMVYEREKRLKESMKVMGLSNWLHWTAWFTKDFLFVMVSTICLVIMLSFLLHKSSALLIFIFLTAYVINLISFSFLVSVFFSKANQAATAAGLIFFLAYLPFILVQGSYSSLSLSTKLTISLFGNSAMSFGSQIIIMWEGSGSGVQFSNILDPASPDDNISLFHCILMLLLDSVLYAILTWYIEAVKPGDFGMPQPFYFPFMPSYWSGKRTYVDVEIGNSIGEPSEFMEAQPIGLAPGIQIIDLTKVYPPRLRAVSNLSLNMYHGQITALLGHNGAGKSTTMSMLTGIYPPTCGTAIVDCYDIRSDIGKIRESLGYCPQHDVLFDQLTVEEHLYFFCTLKGWKGQDVHDEIDRMIKAMGLEDKRNTYSKNLSGGMKRKLSVGIALCAGSKIVMLDEPTSGMDPSARRSTWDLLNSEKNKRTILLTTHYMEEADVLGDRIAIMAGGKLKCCGSSMFLKKKYGAGYHMVLVKDDSCDMDVVSEIVSRHIPNAELESNMGAELSFTLPHDNVSSFQAMFQEIEDRKESIGITGYGASITTMEEVFIKVGENIENGEDGNERMPDLNTRSSYNSLHSIETEFAPTPKSAFSDCSRNTGLTLFFQQVWALFVKRMMYTWRSKILTLSQFVLPIVMTVLALVALKTIPKPENSPPLEISLKKFQGTNVPAADLAPVTSESSDLLKTYGNLFKDTNDKFINVSSATNDTKFIDYLAKEGEKDKSMYALKWIIGVTISSNETTKQLKLIALFNNQPYHSPPISLLAVQNMLFKAIAGSDYNLQIVNHPLPRTPDVIALQESSQGRDSYQIAQNVMFGMIFLSASFLMFIVKERAVRAKHLQVVSGVNVATFWLTTFLWDIINYMVPALLSNLVFVAFKTEGFKESYMQGSLALLLFLNGLAMLPAMYSVSFLFTVPSAAYSRCAILMIVIGIATLLTVSILEIPVIGKEDIARTLEWPFSFLPMYCLSRAIYLLNQNFEYNKLCDEIFDNIRGRPGHIPMNFSTRAEMCEWFGRDNPCCPDKCSDGFCINYKENYNDWEQPGIGRPLVFLAIDAAIFLVILILIEKNVFRKIKYLLCSKSSVKPQANADDNDYIMPKDDDVASEAQRILKKPLNDLTSTELLIFRDLTKSYGSFQAVDHLCLGISRGECFGLLGMNGAGKTSTFKMITGDEGISEGDAYLDGFSVKHNIAQVQKRLGYCPQFDALIDELTGEETLRLFARLRGVPERKIQSVIKQLANELLIEKHMKKLTREYSGGNKRKLSTAIALIGEPPVIFLDEPTAGVDPVARRYMWRTITQVKQSGRSILLTSHSMEECEALCGRLVIMVNGTFCCLGSPQHLKNKFGKGYTILAKINTDEDDNDHSNQRQSIGHKDRTSSMYLRSVSRVSQSTHDRVESFKSFFTKTFPNAELVAIHQAFVHYHIPSGPEVGWAFIFGTMENAKDEYHIEDYTVSQTSLEQVFLQFAKMQRNADD